MSILLGLAAGLIQVGSYIPYVRSILRGETKPNIVSWLLWTLTVSLIILGELHAGPTWSLLLLVGADIGNITIVALAALGYGYRAFGRVEWATLVLASSSIILWQVTGEPLIAVLFAVFADVVAYVPTLVKTYGDPHSETYLFWFANVIADSFAALAPLHLDIPTLLFALPYGMMNALVLAIIFLRRRQTLTL